MKDLTPVPNTQRILKNLHPYAMNVLCDKYLFDLTYTATFIAAIDCFLT